MRLSTSVPKARNWPLQKDMTHPHSLRISKSFSVTLSISSKARQVRASWAVWCCCRMTWTKLTGKWPVLEKITSRPTTTGRVSWTTTLGDMSMLHLHRLHSIHTHSIGLQTPWSGQSTKSSYVLSRLLKQGITSLKLQWKSASAFGTEGIPASLSVQRTGPVERQLCLHQNLTLCTSRAWKLPTPRLRSNISTRTRVEVGRA